MNEHEDYEALLERALRAEAELERLKAEAPEPELCPEHGLPLFANRGRSAAPPARRSSLPPPPPPPPAPAPESELGIPRGPGGILLPPKFINRADHDIAATYMGATVALWTSRAGQAWTGGTWSNGELWSTAWSREYNNARDTQGSMNGRGTPGWGSGQFWSTSTSQWEQNALAWYNNYNAAYTNRYNEGYTNGNNAGYAAGRAAYKARAWVVGLHGSFGDDGEGWMLLDSGSPDGGYWTNSAETVYLVRTGYYMVSANLGNINSIGGKNCCPWTGINSYLEVGNAGQFGSGQISLSYDSDDYHAGGYGWGFAGVLTYSSANAWCRVRVDPAVVNGVPNFTGRMVMDYLGPEAP